MRGARVRSRAIKNTTAVPIEYCSYLLRIYVFQKRRVFIKRATKLIYSIFLVSHLSNRFTLCFVFVGLFIWILLFYGNLHFEHSWKTLPNLR